MAERVGISPVREVANAESASQRAPQPRTANRGVDRFLHVQQAIGNRAMQSLLANGLLQPKLRIGPVDDVYEREADQTADRVMRMPDPHSDDARPLQGPISRVQRMCMECEEEQIQRKCAKCEKEEEEEDGSVQRKSRSSGESPVESSVGSRMSSLRGGGQPLPPAARSFFEPRFNHDFRDVRLHTGETAAGVAAAINARAFTLGRDIVFNAGEYEPHSNNGRRLLAHELTHVVQQTGQKPRTATVTFGSSNGSAAVGSLGTSVSIRESVGSGQAPPIQRQFLPSAGSLIGNGWLALPRWAKAKFIDNAIDALILVVDKFPGRALVGSIWVFMRAGLLGFYKRLQDEKEETKILVADKLAKIMAGNSPAYALGLLVGLLKGFFIDGLLGIFIAIWGLIKVLGHLWSFFAQVGKIIAGFPDDIKRLLQGFQALGQELAANMGPALKDLIATVVDPKRAQALIALIYEHGKAFAKTAGEKLAGSLLTFFSKPGAEKQTGELTGRIMGMVIFEVVFAVVTAGGGAAVTGVKVAMKFLVKIGGKIVGSVLKIFKAIHSAFDTVVTIAKRAAKFVTGKVLKSVTTRFAKLLEDIKIFAAKILKRCRQRSPITCDFDAAKSASRVGLAKARKIAGYADDDLARVALQHRRANTLGRKGNVVVIEYELNGAKVVKAVDSVGKGGRHSEFVAREALPEGASLKRLFTERQPCQLHIPNCDRMLARDFPDADISYLVEYGDAASRTKGNTLLRDLLRKEGL